MFININGKKCNVTYIASVSEHTGSDEGQEYGIKYVIGSGQELFEYFTTETERDSKLEQFMYNYRADGNTFISINGMMYNAIYISSFIKETYDTDKYRIIYTIRSGLEVTEEFDTEEDMNEKYDILAAISFAGTVGCMSVVDKYSDLEAGAETGTLAIVLKDTILPHATHEIVEGTKYSTLYVNPIIPPLSEFELTEDIEEEAIYLGEIPQEATLSVYPEGEGENELINVPTIQISTAGLLSGMQGYQLIWIYVEETIEFMLDWFDVVLEKGWNKVNLNFMINEQGEMDRIMYINVVHNQPIIFGGITLGTAQTDLKGVQNEVFDTTPYVVHYAGIYIKSEDGWVLNNRSCVWDPMSEVTL